MKRKVIIIGGGLGAMSAAISLAATQQFEITLIEKNSHLGGKLNVVEKDGFSFDLGPSILTMPHIFERLFLIHGKRMEDYVKFIPVSPHWRNFFEDGTRFDLEDRLSKMQANEVLSESDIEDLHRFMAYAKKLYHFSNQTMFEHQSERKRDTLRYYPAHKIISDSDMFSTMDEGVRRFIKNPYLIDVLNFFIKYVGSSPYDAPAVMNLLPFIQWEFGLWYVEGGLFNLSKALTRLIDELKIDVLINEEVVGVDKVDGHLSQVHLKSGTSLSCDVVVSNMEAIPFYRHITQEKSRFVDQLEQKYAPACSGFALHLGLNRSYPQLAHHNFFFAKDAKHHFDKLFKHPALSNDPTMYVVAPMKTDPKQGPKGGEIIKVLPHVPVVQDPAFSPDDYAAYKESILTKLERMGLEKLREHIVTEEIWTPERIQSTYYSNRGAIYGVVADKDRNMGFKVPKQSSKYRNLFFVGGSTNPGGGMPMVVLSGQQVVDQILKK